jgi:hypothetical protein
MVLAQRPNLIEGMDTFSGAFVKDFRLIIAVYAALLSASATAPQLDTEALDSPQQLMDFGSRSSECFPIFIRHEEGIDILQDYCSELAFEKQGETQEISENFSVPAELARRYNFWRRIYSLWSHDQFVIHSSEYPEFIMEVLDISRDSISNAIRRDVKVRRLFKQRAAYYKKLLLKMHSMGAGGDYDAEMQRLANSMRHISDKKKYLIAAHSIRMQRGQYEQIASGLERANKYLDAVAQAFEDEGIPSEISRIAFVESSFNIKAR